MTGNTAPPSGEDWLHSCPTSLASGKRRRQHRHHDTARTRCRSRRSSGTWSTGRPTCRGWRSMPCSIKAVDALSTLLPPKQGLDRGRLADVAVPELAPEIQKAPSASPDTVQLDVSAQTRSTPPQTKDPPSVAHRPQRAAGLRHLMCGGGSNHVPLVGSPFPFPARAARALSRCFPVECVVHPVESDGSVTEPTHHGQGSCVCGDVVDILSTLRAPSFASS